MSSKSNEARKARAAILLPVDFALLEALPDEGSMIGYKAIALQVASITDRPDFDEFSGNQIAGRLKSMQRQGLTVTQVTLPLQRGLGWQRTAKGKKVLAENGKVAV